jgi:uncharacterized DUF497 family protein
MGQFKFEIWLAYWYLQNESFDFQWDSGNFSKSVSKHGVEADEVESVFTLRMAVPIGRQIGPLVDEERLCVVGPSQNGKFLSIVFTLRGGKVRPISSRPANKKEKNIYEEVRKTLERIRQD